MNAGKESLIFSEGQLRDIADDKTLARIEARLRLFPVQVVPVLNRRHTGGRIEPAGQSFGVRQDFRESVRGEQRAAGLEPFLCLYLQGMIGAIAAVISRSGNVGV